MIRLLALFSCAVAHSSPASCLVSTAFCAMLFAFPKPISAWPDFRTDLQTFLSSYTGDYDEYLGGGKELSFFVPEDKLLVDQQFNALIAKMGSAIGQIDPPANKYSAIWRNSAKTISELITDASNSLKDFKSVIEAVLGQVAGASDTGFVNAIKTNSSLERKIESKTLKAKKLNVVSQVAPLPIQEINDALRATIVVETLEQLLAVTKNLRKILQDANHGIAFENHYVDPPPSGYFGVHATVLLINSATNRRLLAEIQIHFKRMYDGREDCPKEYTHTVYEVSRSFKSVIPQLNDDTAPKWTAERVVARGNLAQKIVHIFALKFIVNNLPQGQNGIPPPECIVNRTSYHIVEELLLKATYDNDDVSPEVTAIQMFNPENKTWTDCCVLSAINNETVGQDYAILFYGWLGWIQDDEDADFEAVCITAEDAWNYSASLQSAPAPSNEIPAQEDRGSSLSALDILNGFLRYGLAPLCSFIVGVVLMYLVNKCKNPGLCCCKKPPADHYLPLN